VLSSFETVSVCAFLYSFVGRFFATKNKKPIEKSCDRRAVLVRRWRRGGQAGGRTGDAGGGAGQAGRCEKEEEAQGHVIGWPKEKRESEI
jgi:hypothetical protein